MKFSRFILALTFFALGFSGLQAQDEDDEIQRARLKTRQQQTLYKFQKLLENLRQTAKLLERSDLERASKLNLALARIEEVKILEKMDQVIEYLQNEDKKYSAKNLGAQIVQELDIVLGILRSQSGQASSESSQDQAQNDSSDEAQDQMQQLLANQKEAQKKLDEIDKSFSTKGRLGRADLKSLKDLEKSLEAQKEEMQALKDLFEKQQLPSFAKAMEQALKEESDLLEKIKKQDIQGNLSDLNESLVDILEDVSWTLKDQSSAPSSVMELALLHKLQSRNLQGTILANQSSSNQAQVSLLNQRQSAINQMFLELAQDKRRLADPNR